VQLQRISQQCATVLLTQLQQNLHNLFEVWNFETFGSPHFRQNQCYRVTVWEIGAELEDGVEVDAIAILTANCDLDL